ncbi:NADPH-dependent FMN reductase [Variovorax sp. dw_308]|uniref:NADPH-dependent FMN reductase n=1 Tax=Variovorax sp. dw_308 TaxID=2721546 RepID=UPI001C467F35|nr:NAD(P)H-dependent oxidoreductase [Variovorax sp. dw_308]
MNNPLIGVIVGSSGQGGRFGEVPAHWIYRVAEQRSDMRIELIDLGRHPLPFFGAPVLPASRHDEGSVAQRWMAVLDRLDGFIVVASEEDPKRSPGAPTDAEARLGAFADKPIAFVGYGRHAGDADSDPLRNVALALQMAPVTRAVHVSRSEVVGIWQQGKTFEDFPHLDLAAAAMLDDLARSARALMMARDGGIEAVAASPLPVAPARAARPARTGFVRAFTHRLRLVASRVVGASDAAATALANRRTSDFFGLHLR